MFYFIALIVALFAPVTSPLATFMYAIGTGDLGCLEYVWDRTESNDTLTVITWIIHLVTGLTCFLFNIPMLNTCVQLLLGTVVQHHLWMRFNPHKREKKGHLFVPFWSLPPFEAWKDVCVTFLPMLISVWVFGF
jgi:hypothetical protein